MKRHILVISQYFPPDITAAAFRIGSLCDFLLQHDYQVTVLTSHPHKSNSNPGNHSDKKAGNPLSILRVKINSRRYILQYLAFIIRGFFKILPLAFKNRIDLVFATSPPLSVFSLGFLISRIKRAPLIMDIRDLWPDTPVALGKMGNHSVAYRFFKRYEAFMYRRAHWITCVSEPMKLAIEPATPGKVSVVYNGVSQAETRHLPPSPPPRIETNHPVKVFYYGNIGLAQGLDIVVDTAERLDSGIHFHLVGEGALKQNFINAIESRKLDNFHIHPPLSKRQLMEKVATEAQILLINLEDHPVFHRTIPSKLFDYLLHCLPVVYGIKGEGAAILKKTDAAIAFEPNSVSSLAKALEAAVSNYSELLHKARANNPKVVVDYTREKNFEKLLKIIKKNFS